MDVLRLSDTTQTAAVVVIAVAVAVAVVVVVVVVIITAFVVTRNNKQKQTTINTQHDNYKEDLEQTTSLQHKRKHAIKNE